MRRLNEIIWLLLAVIMLGFGLYDWWKNGFLAEAWKFLLLALGAFVFFVLKKAMHLADDNDTPTQK